MGFLGILKIKGVCLRYSIWEVSGFLGLDWDFFYLVDGI